MHSIGVFLGKKSEVDADSKITKKLDLGSDIVAILDYEDDHDIKISKTVAYIRTDYFGGFGDQSAILYVNGKEIYNGDTELGSGSPINEALKLLGVERSSDNDEFDTIGLGGYRSNDDFMDDLAGSFESDIIKLEVEKIYEQIKSAEERLKELRTICKHEKTFEGNYSWQIGSIEPADICEYCGELIRCK